MASSLYWINKNANLSFGADRLRSQEPLAIELAIAIAGWADIEGRLGELLARILGTSDRKAIANFQRLGSTSAQYDALAAAGNRMLKGEILDAFEAMMMLFQSDAKERNRLVHRLWGISPQIPDGIVLMHAKDSLTARLETEDWFKTTLEYAEQLRDHPDKAELLRRTPLDKSNERLRKRMFVYQMGDFIRIHRDFGALLAIMDIMMLLVIPETPLRDRLLHRLSTQPRFQEAHGRLHGRPKKNPKSQ